MLLVLTLNLLTPATLARDALLIPGSTEQIDLELHSLKYFHLRFILTCIEFVQRLLLQLYILIMYV